MSSNQGVVSGAGTLPGESTKRIGGKKSEGRGKIKAKNVPPPHLKYKTKPFKRPDTTSTSRDRPTSRRRATLVLGD